LSDPVKIGVIGCGVIGRVHLENATQSPWLEPVAVAELRDEPRQQAAERFSIDRAYASAEELLADDQVEAVVLAMPTHVRSKLAPKVLEAGKHLLLEKPTAMHAGEVETLLEKRGSLVVACCSARNRCNEATRVLTDALAARRIGPLREIRLHRDLSAGARPQNDPPPWRVSRSLNGGGVFVNWGSYELDFLFGVTGFSLTPRLVLAHQWPVGEVFGDRVAEGSDAECHLAAHVECEGGIVLRYERNEFAPIQSRAAVEFIGETGALRLDGTIELTSKIECDRADPETGIVTEIVWEGETSHSTGHLGVIENFGKAIRGEEPPLTSLDQGYVLQKLTDAVYASADRGEPVEISTAAPVGA